MMSKANLMEALAIRLDAAGHNVSKAAAGAMLDELAAVAEGEIVRHGEFTVPRIAKLKTADRAAREGRNPATGERVTIPAKRVVRAKAASSMQRALDDA